MMMDIQAFFHAVLVQDAQALRAFFHEDAWVNWPCTNEHFTLEEYIRANCEYPGDWDGELERATVSGTEIIMVCRVYPRDRIFSCCILFADQGWQDRFHDRILGG